MDRWIKILILSLLSPSIVSAGLFDILNETYITDISELPASTSLIPDKAWQPSYEWVSDHCKRDYSPKFVFGWLDIVGFERSVKINDTFYINESAAGTTIIKYESYACVIGHRLFKGPMINKLETYEQNGQLIAKLTSTQVLYSIVGETYYYDNETRTFYDYEPLPLQYDQVLKPVVNITEYNNTLEPKIAIRVIEPNSSRIVIQYGNNTVTQTLKSYHVEQTAKGIYYANTSQLEAWDVQGRGVAHVGNAVIINTNLSTFDYSQLDIRISDIYGTVRTDPLQFNITRLTYESEKIVYNPLLFGFVGTILTLFCASAYLIGRIQT